MVRVMELAQYVISAVTGDVDLLSEFTFSVEPHAVKFVIAYNPHAVGTFLMLPQGGQYAYNLRVLGLV